MSGDTHLAAQVVGGVDPHLVQGNYIKAPKLKSVSLESIVLFHEQRQNYQREVHEYMSAAGAASAVFVPVTLRSMVDVKILKVFARATPPRGTGRSPVKVTVDNITEAEIEDQLNLYVTTDGDRPVNRSTILETVRMDLSIQSIFDRYMRWETEIDDVKVRYHLEEYFENNVKDEIESLIKTIQPQAVKTVVEQWLKEGTKAEQKAKKLDRFAFVSKVRDIMISQAKYFHAGRLLGAEKNKRPLENIPKSHLSKKEFAGSDTTRVHKKLKVATKALTPMGAPNLSGGTVLSRRGQVVECFKCKANHHINHCPKATSEERRSILTRKREEWKQSIATKATAATVTN
jgi:hypothetical protein